MLATARLASALLKPSYSNCAMRPFFEKGAESRYDSAILTAFSWASDPEESSPSDVVGRSESWSVGPGSTLANSSGVVLTMGLPSLETTMTLLIPGSLNAASTPSTPRMIAWRREER